MLFSRGWGFSSDKETGVSACKQLPILVGETDNITIDEVPRMVEGDPQRKRGRRRWGSMQEALRRRLGKDQRQSGAQWGKGCAKQNGQGRLYAYLKRGKETSASGPLWAKQWTKGWRAREKHKWWSLNACSQWKEPWALFRVKHQANPEFHSGAAW